MGKPIKTIGGIPVGSSAKTDQKTRSALIYVDVEISKFLDKVKADTDNTYVNSRDAVKDYYEITGALTFMYMAEMLTTSEFTSICKMLSGEDSVTDD